jgi:peptidoglycan/LPS O-acetylase OafA/YrhL
MLKPSSKVRSSLAEAFDPRKNSLNAIRLVLAVLVIVSHSWPIGGYGTDPQLGDQTLGNWAVVGFFAISGYLITASRLHSRTLFDYLWRRVLRIYPAFVVVLLVVAFGFAPAVVSITGDGSWAPGDGFEYVLQNFALLIRQYGVGDSLNSVPLPHAWNGSLWTLFYEFCCYVAIGLAVSVLPRRWLPAACASALALCACITFLVAAENVTLAQPIELGARLGSYFAGGALLYFGREKVVMSPVLAAAAIGIIAVTAALGVSRAFAALPVAYLMMWLGVVLPMSKLGSKNDISYGVYIYAFPVQQALTYAFAGSTAGPAVFVFFSIASTVPLAWLSWIFIEKPAMRLKSVLPRRGIQLERDVS